jgi:hypothetical protein
LILLIIYASFAKSSIRILMTMERPLLARSGRSLGLCGAQMRFTNDQRFARRKSMERLPIRLGKHSDSCVDAIRETVAKGFFGDPGETVVFLNPGKQRGWSPVCLFFGCGCGRIFDNHRDLLRKGDQSIMATLDNGLRRIHSIGGKILGTRLEQEILVGDNEPRRLVVPSGVTCRFVKGGICARPCLRGL